MDYVALGGRWSRQSRRALHAGFLCALGLIFASGCVDAVRVSDGAECSMEGESRPDSDGCNSCVCQGGKWACTTRVCDDSCVDGETRQESCNTCTCKDDEWLCTRKACLPEVCQEGETKPSDDGCNTCTCVEGGWACTEKACGDVCVEGETRPDDCNVCLCTGGQWACTTKACLPECEEGTSKPIDSCNSCSCSNGSWACTDLACPDLCQDGDTKLATDGCNTCTCYAGVWGCTEMDCTPVCKEGEVSGGCGECSCVNGQWACTDITCPMPPACKEGETKDDGCNTCSCDGNGQWQCTLIDCGVPCGGLGGVGITECGEGQYCAYEASQGHCGILDASSFCRPRPDVCPTVDEPVCACNGLTYSNACEAARDGWGVMSSGECEYEF